MYRKIMPFLIAIIALIIPLLIKPVYQFFVWSTSSILPENFKAFINYFAMDQSLYLMILTIEATTLVAIAIYWMQNRRESLKEKELKKKAKTALFNTLVASLQEVHKLSRLDLYEEQDYRFIRISEKHFEAITEIEGLSEKDIRFLNGILKELEYLIEHELDNEVGDIRLRIDKLIADIMIPAYVQYKYEVGEPKDAFEVMNEQLLSILRKYDYAEDSERKSAYLSKDRKIIIKYNSLGKAVVYNKAGEKICNAEIDKKGIRSGWARLYNEGTLLYEGGWQNYKKHGQGSKYFYDYGNYQYVSKEGTWKNGNLKDGTIHDVLVQNKNALTDKSIIQINEEFINEDATHIKDLTQYKVANLNVVAGKIDFSTFDNVREVKAVYEEKYGVGEWWYADHSADEQDEELPVITVELNISEELIFNPDIEVDTMSLPTEAKLEEIPLHLQENIKEGEIAEYNAQLPGAIAQINTYNRELIGYMSTKVLGVELDLSVINQGKSKANDIYVDLIFPRELVVIEGTLDGLEPPDMPEIADRPLDKARKRASGIGRFFDRMGGVGINWTNSRYIKWESVPTIIAWQS